jgi:hypothetical protein
MAIALTQFCSQFGMEQQFQSGSGGSVDSGDEDGVSRLRGGATNGMGGINLSQGGNGYGCDG